ncbi:MAG: D-glycerate dehydrogenase [Kiloniellales bacterium]|nr:D-glycerate dehydrogenase [Kiloniellales bacterium]
MSKPKVIVTRRWPEAVEQRMSELFDAEFNADDRPMDRAALKAAFGGADAVFATVSDRIDAAVLAGPVRARFLGNFGVGVEHIDIQAAKARGIVVTNTPGVLTDATADLTMTLILMVARRAAEGERHVRAGAWTGWRPTHMMGAQVAGKTLGVIGLGRVGKAVARRAGAGFGMRVLSYGRNIPSFEEARAAGVEPCATLGKLLEESDFVSLHCPGGSANRHMINEECLQRMKKTAYLINTARGDVVDEPALVQALKRGVIAGAGLDVYESEPRVPPELLAMDNVVLLPHLGSATIDTRVAMGMKVVENASAFFSGGSPPNRIV